MDLGNFFESLIKNMSDTNRIFQQTEVGSLMVSTVYTYDCGYETAIVDSNGEVYPVERYGDGDFEAGHWRWCERAKTIDSIVKLGYPGLSDDEKIILKR